MSTEIDTFTLQAERVGSIGLPDSFLAAAAHPQMVKNYAVAIQKNQRQWSASTKGRSEVNHSGQKPHAQKGTGKARQGYLGTPQYKGGGVVFGPKPKFNQHVRINQKERRATIRHLICNKMRAGEVVALQDPELSEPKTASIARFLRALNLEGGILIVLPSWNRQNPIQTQGDGDRGQSLDLFCKSARNIPKVKITNLASLNGVDLLSARRLVFLKTALTDLLQAEEETP